MPGMWPQSGGIAPQGFIYRALFDVMQTLQKEMELRT
jgi:hypothetical protein